MKVRQMVPQKIPHEPECGKKVEGKREFGPEKIGWENMNFWDEGKATRNNIR